MYDYLIYFAFFQQHSIIIRLLHVCRILEYSTQPDKVKNQDLFYVLSGVASNPLGRLHAWRFLRSSWETIYDV